jgi:hypothetical protein
MNIRLLSSLLAVLSLHASPVVLADTLASSMGVFVYPAKGQSNEQLGQDDYQCFSWAREQTHYDPMNPPDVAPQAPDQGPRGERLRGAARGAAAGAVVSEITDNDTSDAMAGGAVLGAMRGGQRDRMQRQQETAQAEAAADQQQAGAANQFKSAYAACIEARGYSVKY